MYDLPSRRSLLKTAAMGFAQAVAEEPKIPGFEEVKADSDTWKNWRPVSDRKIRMGIAGFGLCKFGAVFYLPRISHLTPDELA